MTDTPNRNRTVQRRVLCSALFASTALIMGASAHAEDAQQADSPAAAAPTPAAAAQPANDQSIQDITVTARRRSELLTQVPDTITAFSKQDIKNRQLTQLDDFIHLTPNAKIVREQDIATSELYIRGVGSNKGQASAVAYVVDGVILPTQDAYTIDLSDADQVEILKGPQGALYGKGALAGVVNIKTREPTTTPYIDIKGDVASQNTYGAFVSVGGPIAGSTLLGSLNFKFNKTDGDFNNEYNNTGIERNRDFKVSGKLIWQPTDNLKFEYAGTYYNQHSGNPPYNGVNILGTGSTRITSSEAASPIAHNTPDIDRRKVFTSSLIGTLTLPFGTLSSITAYDKVNFAFQQDTDFTALDVFSAAETRYSRGVSQELRFTSPGEDRFRYILSVYYDNTQDNRIINGYGDFCFLGIFGAAQCPNGVGNISGVLTNLPLQNTKVNTNEYAASAQADYDITRTLQLTAAIRYDADKPKQQDLLHSVAQRGTFKDWQPKASLAYKPSRDFTAYATYSHGYKPGLFNPPQAAGSPFPERVKQEGTDNFELGIKSGLFDRKLVLTGAVFQTNYKNAQEFHLDVQSGGNQAINVRKTRIRGFELAAEARPLPHLDLNAAFGYTRSRILDFDGTDNYVGQSLPYQPRYTINAGAQYSYPLPSGVTVTGRVDYTRDGKTSFQDFQNPNTNQYLYQASDQTVDLRLTVGKKPWEVSVFGHNIFNQRYVYSAYSRYISALIFAPLNEDVVLPAPGVTYGAEVRLSF